MGRHEGFKGFAVELQVTDTAEFKEWAVFEGQLGELMDIPEGFDGDLENDPIGLVATQKYRIGPVKSISSAAGVYEDSRR